MDGKELKKINGIFAAEKFIILGIFASDLYYLIENLAINFFFHHFFPSLDKIKEKIGNSKQTNLQQMKAYY